MNKVSVNEISQVIFVLGKRLVGDQLTAEGVSRIEALERYLGHVDIQSTALVFCGGVLANQQFSEAELLFTRFKQSSRYYKAFSPAQLILEDQSTNTVENIYNASIELLNSGICRCDVPVEFVLASNDYHVGRIIEIQTLMPEQGLLTVLLQRCSDAGLECRVSLDLSRHCIAPYPHHNELGSAFLLVDQLTTYRVFLEGVVRKVFTPPKSVVRQQAVNLAHMAIRQLKSLSCMHGYMAMLDRLEALVDLGSKSDDMNTLRPTLNEYHALLTELNRAVDPETAVGK